MNPYTEQYPDSLNKKRLYTVVATEAGSYLTGLSLLYFIWYKDHARVPFHFYDDSKGYLQIDKAGHAFSAYRESYAAYHALRWAGMDKKRALIFGGPLGLVFQTPIEIFDGLYEGWGFSWSDMVANTFGSLLFTSQEAILMSRCF
ncbi:MAG: YfiM family protein [Cyclobacteriaceae bacterium]|nr:YfiM family protein [Cyclobacteriaceae bacterium]